MPAASWLPFGPSTTFVNSGRYWPVGSSQLLTGVLTESNVQSTSRITGTYSNPSVRVTANNGTATIQFRVNGANGNQAISIGSSLTGEFSDPVNTDAVNNFFAFLVNWQITQTATSITINSFKSLFFATTGIYAQKLGANSSGNAFSTANTTQYSRLVSAIAWGTNAGNEQAILQAPVTSEHLLVVVSANARTPDATTFGTFKNAANGNMTISVAALTTGTFEDNVNTDSFVAGDLCVFRITTGASATAITTTLLSMDMVSVTDSQHLIASFAAQTFSASNNTFHSFGYTKSAGDTVESNVQHLIGVPLVVSKLWTNNTANTRSDATTVQLRKNGSNSPLFASITAGNSGAFSDNIHTDTLASTDEIDLNVVTGSGTGSINMQHVVLLGEIRVAPDAVATTTTFPAPGISTGLTSTALATTAGFPAPSLVQVLNPAALVTTTAFGFQPVQLLQPAALSTTATLLSPTIIQRLQPSALATSTAFGFQVVQNLQMVALSTTASLPTPVISQILQPGALATTAALPAPTIIQRLQPGALATITSLPTSTIVQVLHPAALVTNTQLPSVTIVQRLQPSPINTLLEFPVAGIGQSALFSLTALATSAGFPSPTLISNVTLQPSSLSTSAGYPASAVVFSRTVFPAPIATVYAQMDIGLLLGRGTTISPSSLALVSVFPVAVPAAGSVVRPSSTSTTSTLNSNPTVLTGQGVRLNPSSVNTSLGLPAPALSTSRVLQPASLATTVAFPARTVIVGVGTVIAATAIVSTAGIPTERGEGGAAVVFPNVFPVQSVSQIRQPFMTIGVTVSPQPLVSVSTFPGGSPPGVVFPVGTIPVDNEGVLVSGGMLMNDVTQEDMVRTDRLLS